MYGLQREIHDAASRLMVVLAVSCLALMYQPALTMAQVPKAEDEPKEHVITPVFVFVPGLYGSVLEACNGTPNLPATRCKAIWGNITIAADLLFNRSQNYRATLWETAAASPVFSKKIYGRITELLDEYLFDQRNYFAFPYDWRASNIENAKKLKMRLCAIRNQVAEAQIYIIAHSMGGLVTKRLLTEKDYADCPNGKKLDIRGVALIATPHLGTPRTLAALVQSYSFFGHDTLAKAFDYLGGAISRSALSFDSTFELLPLLGSSACSAPLEKYITDAATFPIQFPLRLVDRRGLTTNVLDVAPRKQARHKNQFDFSNWKGLGLLVHAKEKRYHIPNETELAERLRDAEIRNCALALENWPKLAYRYYVVGLINGATAGSIDILTTSSKAILKSASVSVGEGLARGDGTVPIYSASDVLHSEALSISKVEGGAGEHLEILPPPN